MTDLTTVTPAQQKAQVEATIRDYAAQRFQCDIEMTANKGRDGYEQLVARRASLTEAIDRLLTAYASVLAWKEPVVADVAEAAAIDAAAAAVGLPAGSGS